VRCCSIGAGEEGSPRALASVDQAATNVCSVGHSVPASDAPDRSGGTVTHSSSRADGIPRNEHARRRPQAGEEITKCLPRMPELPFGSLLWHEHQAVGSLQPQGQIGLDPQPDLRPAFKSLPGPPLPLYVLHPGTKCPAKGVVLVSVH
jgi:hypothetical protein